MKVLGIDPGSARTGFGVVREKSGKHTLITSGCITTSKRAKETIRLKRLYDQLDKLYSHYNPDAVAIESLFFAKNAKTAISVGQARGIVLLISGQHKKEVVSYAPLEVKLAVAGYGNADKHQVQIMVKNILGLSQIIRPDDAADAVAVALTHCFSQRMRKTERRNEAITQ